MAVKKAIAVICFFAALLTASAAFAGHIDANGKCKGIRLWGKVQVVESFPDLRVQVVESFPDLRVQTVKALPDRLGEWQLVSALPDFTIQFVNSFPDLKIQFVNAFPGKP